MLMDYKETQTEKYKSFESEHQHWRKGQERFIHKNFFKLDHDLKILDLGCGDGVGLAYFKLLGFRNVTGVEFCAEKAKKAAALLGPGYSVLEIDMHDLNDFVIDPESMDIIYSSHSLEHTHNPNQVIRNIHRILKPGGLLFVVLPYPDTGPDDAHCGKKILHSDINDGAAALETTFTVYGFETVSKHFDSYREPEVWFTFKK